MKRPKGSWSRLSVTAMVRAEEMQQLATLYINEMFAVETDEVDLRTMTLKSFLDALETARNNGTMEEFEARLAAQITPIAQQLMSPPTGEEGQTGA